MKTIGVVLLIIVVFVAGFLMGQWESSVKSRAEIVRLSGSVDIYRNEAEKYAKTIRMIRETATQATATEKAL